MTDILTIPVPEPDGDPRLQPFKELNKRKASWEERVDLIKEQFPSVSTLDWGKLFTKDPVILGKIINDILKKSDAEEPSRPGKRPNLGEKATTTALAKLGDLDHTSTPFHHAFTVLKGDRTVRAVAHKVDLPPVRVHRLLSGELRPTASDMEAIAKGFKRDPSYFYEYRAAFITAVVVHRLERYKDSSVVLYNQIKSLMR